MATKRRSIGRAVDECIKETTEEWFRMHQGYRTREEAAAYEWQQLTVTVQKKKGGVLEVHCAVITHDRRTTHTDWFPFQQSGSSGYIPTAHGKAKV